METLNTTDVLHKLVDSYNWLGIVATPSEQEALSLAVNYFGKSPEEIELIKHINHNKTVVWYAHVKCN